MGTSALGTIRRCDVQPGDLLAIRGVADVSAGIRTIDGADYDHVALVVAVDGHELLLTDVSFGGWRRFRLEDYDDIAERILVRRHRVPNGGRLIAARANAFGGNGVRYAFDGLGQIILISLVRHMPVLASHDADRARSFVGRMFQLFGLAVSEYQPTGTAVCVDLIMATHDVLGSGGPDASYYGVVLRNEGIGGLLAWAASAASFADYMNDNAAFDAAVEPLDDTAMSRLEWVMYRDLGIVGASTTTVPSDGELRELIVASGKSMATLLGIGDPLGRTRPESLSVMAMYLLNRFLTHRVIVTPRDLCTTRSFYDVGVLDLDGVRWRSRG